MTDLAQRLKSELGRLPESDRAELAHFLLHTLEPSPEVDTDSDAVWEAELGKRLLEIRENTLVGEPAEQVFAEMRKKHA